MGCFQQYCDSPYLQAITHMITQTTSWCRVCGLAQQVDWSAPCVCAWISKLTRYRPCLCHVVDKHAEVRQGDATDLTASGPCDVCDGLYCRAGLWHGPVHGSVVAPPLSALFGQSCIQGLPTGWAVEGRMQESVEGLARLVEPWVTCTRANLAVPHLALVEFWIANTSNTVAHQL